MTKIKQALFLIATAMLCMFFVSGHSSIVSKAAQDTGISSSDPSGTLYSGRAFRATLREFTGTDKKTSPSITTIVKEENIKHIVFLSSNSTQSLSGLEKKTIGKDVFAYYNDKNQTIYIHSAAGKFFFNSDSENMFRDFAALESIKQ